MKSTVVHLCYGRFLFALILCVLMSDDMTNNPVVPQQDPAAVPVDPAMPTPAGEPGVADATPAA